MVMEEENKNRWNSLPKEIRRRFTPERLDDEITKVLEKTKEIHQWLSNTYKNKNTRLEVYLDYFFHTLIGNELNIHSSVGENRSKLFRIFKDGLTNCYKDRIINEFEKHSKPNVQHITNRNKKKI